MERTWTPFWVGVWTDGRAGDLRCWTSECHVFFFGFFFTFLLGLVFHLSSTNQVYIKSRVYFLQETSGKTGRPVKNQVNNLDLLLVFHLKDATPSEIPVKFIWLNPFFSELAASDQHNYIQWLFPTDEESEACRKLMSHVKLAQLDQLLVGKTQRFKTPRVFVEETSTTWTTGQPFRFRQEYHPEAPILTPEVQEEMLVDPIVAWKQHVVITKRTELLCMARF